MKIQQWTNKRKLTESWSYGCLGSSLRAKDRVESFNWQRRFNVLSGWLASSYRIRPAFLQHISWRVSVRSVINKQKRSCHFAWRNGSIAVWTFVHPTEYGWTLDWKAFLSVKNYFYQHQNITVIIKGEGETCPNFWNRTLSHNAETKDYARPTSHSVRGWTGKNKAFCSPGTQNSRRVIKVYCHIILSLEFIGSFEAAALSF